MSHSAYRARLRNLTHWTRSRTYGETRRIEVEIALASHGHESYRGIARRLGLRSHAYCWRVIRRYRTGQIPSLPPDEEVLLSMRESLGEGVAGMPLAKSVRASVGAAQEYGGLRASFSPVMTTDERIAERWREVEEWKRKNLRPDDTRRRIRVPIPM